MQLAKAARKQRSYTSVLTLVVCALLGMGITTSCTDAAQNKSAAKPEKATQEQAKGSPIGEDLKAPAKYTVEFETTKGKFQIEVDRAMAPVGADRFYTLVKQGFFTDIAFFRVLSGFVAQFGIHGDPAKAMKWREKKIKDDPVKGTNAKGTLTFATAGPNTRTTQLFLNLVDNKRLDGMGFAPFGKVTSGMDVVSQLYSGYGEGSPMGSGPAQGRIQTQGNKYLKKDFPKLDYIKSAKLL